MDDSVLWAIAIGTGVIGLLLLAVAGGAAIYWNVVARRPRGAAFDNPQSRAGDLAAAGERSPAGSPAGSHTTPTMSTPGPLLWIKAWVFDLFHAGTVSVVMGGITLFEDLAKASEEIQSTGTVTFPKQLLPGPFSSPTNSKRLSKPSGDSSKAGEPDPDDTSGWEIVDRVNEMNSDRR